ncbi:hypothetical protein [Luteibacter sp. E-22]|uniref:hypothetical protein n=1 Tax=Luteibacter sp. E-22 TaxID=3404050 RepID=UPI003CF950AD
MRLTDLFWISENRAREFGFTHHGRIYGIPAWISEEGPDVVMACPKVGVLQVVAMTADTIFEGLSWLMPADRYVETPMHIGAPIV